MRGMNAVMLSKMKAISQENRRLKRMYAENQMQNELLKAMLGKRGKALIAQGDSAVDGAE